VFGNVARGYAFGRVAASTRKTYEVNWGMWVSWKSLVGKECWLNKYMGHLELAERLAEFMRCCRAGKGNKKSTIVGKLVAINV